tara:strand:+ start:2965 stop:3636 length:672 start_codon:yes stop_codon:yes gene_type:complete
MSKTKAKEATNKIVEVEKNELAQESKFTVDSSDIQLPRYSLRQASSKFKAGETGDLVKDQEYVVIPASSETDIVFVDVRKKWREQAPFGSQIRGRVAYTEQEKEEIESDTEFEVKPAADLIFLIPEGKGTDEDAFNYPLGDTNYALGIYDTGSKGAYRGTFMQIATFLATNPAASPANVMWTWRVVDREWMGNEWVEPMLKISRNKVDQDVLEFATNYKNITS